MKKYAVQCKDCGTIHHGKVKDDCPCCGAIGKGKSIPIKAKPMRELLMLDEEISCTEQ